MDDKRFDELALRLHDSASRRAAFRVLGGSVLAGAVGWLGLDEGTDAKRKHKKKKKGGRCPKSLPVWCPPILFMPAAFCMPHGYHCCPAAYGGHACPPGTDCCPPTFEYFEGACVEHGYPCPTNDYAAATEGGIYPQQTEVTPRQRAKP